MKLYDTGVYLVDGTHIVPDGPDAAAQIKRLSGQTATKERARENTIAWPILRSHNTTANMEQLRLKFDTIASHDITYVGIIQTARASGMTEFPLPYVLTNCHNSLCAVGGTINEDDHMFALSAAKKYGGIYVPTNLAVIHQYMRETMAGCGRMILASDSHTRYGALGTLAIGEGGGELAKQLLGRTYDIAYPGIVGVYLKNAPRPGVGPQDVALSIIGQVFDRGYVKNQVMEFIGDGIHNLPVEYRNGIDVMTTETTCLSSIWRTDDSVREYLGTLGRADAYRELAPGNIAYYDGMIEIDLAAIEPMIALPFHPSNVYAIADVQQNAADILDQVERSARDLFGKENNLRLLDKVGPAGIQVDQGIVAGCAGGTFHNLCAVADILGGHTPGNNWFSMSAYPSSQPTYLALMQNGCAQMLMNAGVIMREAFCGPCFGAGDVPANGALSIRHTTRNFPNREGSKPGDGQIAAVALMDARSIAATAVNGGKLTAATQLEVEYSDYSYSYNDEVYRNRVYSGYGRPDPTQELRFGPNIVSWPDMPALTDHLLLKMAAFITDPVTTTDELIPSGETSSYRSNPLRLSEFTLSRKDPGYVKRAKEIQRGELLREEGTDPGPGVPGLEDAINQALEILGGAGDPLTIGIGSAIYAVKPGDGSAREQAASCQKVLGGWANLAQEYATKRYRSNLINWGILPFLIQETPSFGLEDYLFVPNIGEAVRSSQETITAYQLGKDIRKLSLSLGELTDDERTILLEGCLINYYKAR